MKGVITRRNGQMRDGQRMRARPERRGAARMSAAPPESACLFR